MSVREHFADTFCMDILRFAVMIVKNVSQLFKKKKQRNLDNLILFSKCICC